ncbi:MAG: hypothetical protein ACJA1A_001067 [Saprospiraceae bacterium]|jgi:hypothetical protein
MKNLGEASHAKFIISQQLINENFTAWLSITLCASRDRVNSTRLNIIFLIFSQRLPIKHITMKKLALVIGLFTFAFNSQIRAQHSVARQWNEQVLGAIRYDFARPTAHARNLFHISAAMYDSWSAYEPTADTYFLGKTVQGFTFPYLEVSKPIDVKSAQEEAMSFAAYRLIKYRFRNAPLFNAITYETDLIMAELGYDINNTNTDYHCGAAELGNYIAERIILYGLQDGANEEADYENLFYLPANPPMTISHNGNPNLIDFNRWQPIKFQLFTDQSGNTIGGGMPEFLGAEWGSVSPFSLKEADADVYEREGFNYKVYLDPGPPAYIDETTKTGLDNFYKWGHSLVAVWSSHLNTNDSTKWDISPASRGNISSYPLEVADYPEFYDLLEGGDTGTGYAQNPKTGLPYEPNFVKRSDYTRVLAEFWADGPDSETPPGHWFTILNTVNDHPDLEKKMKGKGEILDDLEWDVKSYFILGGAMHDVAIASWGIKGWYDYVRPVSAIRGMAERGQGSDPSLPNYHEFGLPLIPNFIELIEADDYLAGYNGENVGQVKMYGWRGPNYYTIPVNNHASVGWIRAKNWWPFQRPTFVTPPFAGYVSGHSTFSRAAAEVLTALTGDPFFPGGMGEFICPKNTFLTFEFGPSEEVTLQWATYRDASDQCSLSRIWGGIHPPVDDIPGRLIGEKIGVDAFNFAFPYFSKIPKVTTFDQGKVFPNPTTCGIVIQYEKEGSFSIQVFQIDGKILLDTVLNFENGQAYLDLEKFHEGIYIVVVRDMDEKIVLYDKVVKE